jgi:hypothetical protein
VQRSATPHSTLVTNYTCAVAAKTKRSAKMGVYVNVMQALCVRVCEVFGRLVWGKHYQTAQEYSRFCGTEVEFCFKSPC